MSGDLATLLEGLKKRHLPALGKEVGDLPLYETLLVGLVTSQLFGEYILLEEYPGLDSETTAKVEELRASAVRSAEEQEYLDYIELLEELRQASEEAARSTIAADLASRPPPFDYTGDQIRYISNPANYCSGEAADLARAVTNLGASGDPRAVGPIIGLLGVSLPCAGLGPEGEWDVSGSVAQALMQLGELAIEPLVEVLLTETGGRQKVAASVLQASPAVKQNDHVVDLLAPALKTSNIFIRTSAAWIFSQVGTPRAASGLIELLGDSEADVRCEVVSARGANCATRSQRPTWCW